jgi:hypothetical protein
LTEPVPAESEATGLDKRNSAVKTTAPIGATTIYPRTNRDASSNSRICPRKPDSSAAESEIYPTSPCIYPKTPVKLVQGEIVLKAAQAHQEKTEFDIERVGALGEIRVDRAVLPVDRTKGVGEIGPELASTVAPAGKPTRPYFTSDGTLRIPFDSDPKYHWWNGGQSVKKTIAELRGEIPEDAASDEVGSDCNY